MSYLRTLLAVSRPPLVEAILGCSDIEIRLGTFELEQELQRLTDRGSGTNVESIHYRLAINERPFSLAPVLSGQIKNTFFDGIDVVMELKTFALVAGRAVTAD